MIDLCKDSETPVGTIDLFDFDPHHMRAGIGILVASTTQRRRGYASDAFSTLLNYCRDVLMLHQVYCHIQASNQASQRLFGGCGFVAERHASAMGAHPSGLGRPAHYAVDSSSMS